MSIESLTAELRQLRARIDFQRDNTHTWPTKDEELAADLLRYDRRLLKAAAVLRVASSGGARGFAELSEAERLDIEHSLDVCGHGVRPSADEGRSVGALDLRGPRRDAPWRPPKGEPGGPVCLWGR